LLLILLELLIDLYITYNRSRNARFAKCSSATIKDVAEFSDRTDRI